MQIKERVSHCQLVWKKETEKMKEANDCLLGVESHFMLEMKNETE